MKQRFNKQLIKDVHNAAVQADILRSAIASFRIEKLTISSEQAIEALRQAEAMLGKLPQ